jgi:GNAT superfamily N-acetyltransferase
MVDRDPARRRRGQRAEALEFHPLVPERWPDLEALFGTRGACGGCWCMTPRLRAREFEAQKGESNRLALRALVQTGPPPGLLGYRAGRAVAWISVEPRERFPRLATSRVLAPVDERAVWAITCFFLAKEERGQGLSKLALEAAAAHARAAGAELLEGYPLDPEPGRTVPAAFAWTGILSAFLAAGFVEVARRSPGRPIVRRRLRANS